GTYLRPAPPECEDGGRPRGATTSTLPGTMLKRLLILGVGFLVGCGADSGGPVDGDDLGGAPGTGGADAAGGADGARGAKASGGSGGDDDSPCDDGDSRTLTCGTNDNGVRFQECVDGRWEDHGCDDRFVSRWRTDAYGDSADDQITLPLVSNGTYDFVVDWGDGTTDTITAWDDPARTHTYPEPGTYTVTIEGDIVGWAFRN